MPGFNVVGLGGAEPGMAGISNLTEVRRKHRWYFQFLGRGAAGAGSFSNAELLVLQSASRPSFKFEQPEMHHNQEVIRFAGKQDWDPITMVWYDSEQDPDMSRGIYHWLETVVQMVDIKVAHPMNYKTNAELVLADGWGFISEQWNMYGCWPAEVNWQELDYTSTDLLTVEVTMRFDRAHRQCVFNTNRVGNTPSCPVS